MSQSQQTCQLIYELAYRKYQALGCDQEASGASDASSAQLYTASSNMSGPPAGALEADGNTPDTSSGATFCQRLQPVVNAIKAGQLDTLCDCPATDLTAQQSSGTQIILDSQMTPPQAPRCMPINYTWQ